MSVVELEQVRAYLRFKGVTANPVVDTTLQDVIDGAEKAIARRVGPLALTEITRRVRGGGSSLVLPVLPAVSLTAVAPIGRAAAAVLVGDLDLDPDSGVVTHLGRGFFPAARYAVTYVAGYDELPEDLELAVKEQVRHLYAPQRGGNNRPGSAPAEPTDAGSGAPLSSRVLELIEPFTPLGLGG